MVRERSRVQSSLTAPFSELQQPACHNCVTVTGGKKMAPIRKRGSRWRAQVRRKDHPARAKSFLDRADALRWAREQELDIDRGEWTTPLQVCSESLSALLTRYETEITPGKRSRSDHFHLRQITRHAIGSCPAKDLTPEKVAQFRDDRLKTVSGSTVRKELALLGSVLKLAIQPPCGPFRNPQLATMNSGAAEVGSNIVESY